MELENEFTKYIKEQLNGSTLNGVKFLLNMWNFAAVDTNEKYEVILKYFLKEFLTICENNLLKEVLELRFPANSVTNDTIKMMLKNIKDMLQNEKTLESIELCTAIISNESYKEFFKSNLNTYCKLVSSTLKSFNTIQCNKYKMLDDIIRELHYFAKVNNFQQIFRQHVLMPLHKASNSEKYERINDTWNIIKSIFFSRSYDEDDTSIKIFTDTDITFEQMEVLLETFIISFKSDSSKIIEFLKHFNEDVISKHENNNGLYLNQMKTLYKLLKKHDIELATIKSINEDFSLEIQSRVSDSIDEMKLCEYFEALTAMITYDPFIFVESDMIYQLLVECMMREKSEQDFQEYEQLLVTIVKIFGKDINQFIKKLLSAVDTKFKNFNISKRGKRKSANEAANPKKKQKLMDGSENCINLANIWPNSIKIMTKEIFSNLNVNQTVKLWKLLNDSLSSVIDCLENSISENILFKIDFISSFICQLVTCSRIHEHLVYKSSEIASAIEDFNNLQHNFYEAIIIIDYDSSVMNAFLKMSYDYENFLMIYFYHYDEIIKSEMDPIFMADQSKMKSSEWKIIGQRIKKFGTSEEKSNSNRLMIQQFIKSKLFQISSSENQNEFVQNIFMDVEQIKLLLEQKDARLHIFNLLNDDDFTTIINDLFKKIKDDKETVYAILNLVKNNSKMLESFLNVILNNHETFEIVKQLPISYLSYDSKKMMIEKLLLKGHEINYFDSIIIFNKIFKNDGYKSFFKDFSSKILFESLPDVNKFISVYEIIIRTNLKKMTSDVLKNLEWILHESNSIDLVKVLGKSMTEINVVPTNECNIEKINKFKQDLISYLSSKLTESNITKEQQIFCIFSRLCSQNMQIINDETKDRQLKLLDKVVKSMGKASMTDTIDVFMLTIKDAKKLNLNDEIKSGIVKTLTKHMYAIIDETLNGENEKAYENERELIATLSLFKTNCREEYSHYLYKQIKSKDIVTDQQLIYCFKMYEILFESWERTEHKDKALLVRNYVKFCENFINVKGKMSNVDLLCSIYAASIALMKSFKEKLDFTVIDELFGFHINQSNRLSFDVVSDFCKYYEIVGQFLFVLGNFHQNYFKSRIPQYFKAYNKFLDAIYFYKADDKEDFDAKESSMLLRLTLQLENIMKMLMKLHSNSFSLISPYIVASIVNVFIKTPKMLNIGDKFKVNIKNICYQLLSTFDDKTRKHIYAVVDESTREVYDSMFKEMKRK